MIRATVFSPYLDRRDIFSGQKSPLPPPQLSAESPPEAVLLLFYPSPRGQFDAFPFHHHSRFSFLGSEMTNLSPISAVLISLPLSLEQRSFKPHLCFPLPAVSPARSNLSRSCFPSPISFCSFQLPWSSRNFATGRASRPTSHFLIPLSSPAIRITLYRLYSFWQGNSL